MRDRRKFLRIPENLPLTYELLLDAKTDESLTEDISQEGIRFFIDSPVPKYSLLRIRLTLQAVSFSFDALVRVVWIEKSGSGKKYEVGAEFISLPREAAEQLIDYIRSYFKINGVNK